MFARRVSAHHGPQVDTAMASCCSPTASLQVDLRCCLSMSDGACQQRDGKQIPLRRQVGASGTSMHVFVVWPRSVAIRSSHSIPQSPRRIFFNRGQNQRWLPSRPRIRRATVSLPKTSRLDSRCVCRRVLATASGRATVVSKIKQYVRFRT